MELKVSKSTKKINLEELKSVGIIDFFFERLQFLPGVDAVTKAACSKDIKVRMRGQFVMLIYARLNILENDTRFLSKPSYSTYLATCIGYAQLHGVNLESVVLPFDDKIWGRLYREFIKMHASIHLRNALIVTSRKLRKKEEKNPSKITIKSKHKSDHVIIGSQDNYTFAKEILLESFQKINVVQRRDSFALDILKEFEKINSLGNLDTLREYYQRHTKNWYFYDFPYFKVKLLKESNSPSKF